MDYQKKIINGVVLAQQIKDNLKEELDKFTTETSIIPCLAVIMVGNNPASEIYVGRKKKEAALVGINAIIYKLPDVTSEYELLKLIDILNKDKSVHSILVQLPLPKNIKTRSVFNALHPLKDVDGFSPYNAGKLATGDLTHDVLLPCTPQGCIAILESIKVKIAGSNVLMIGASNVVGQPLSRLLLYKKATVTLAHSLTKDLKKHCLAADIIISATGVSSLITRDMVNDRQVVIDVGINKKQIDGKAIITGDVDFEECVKIVKAITPVPGGVGPLTIAFTLKNTLRCAILQQNAAVIP